MKEAKPKSEPKQRRVAVLGGGPAGLSAAYRLARDNLPIRVDIYEASGRYGGVLKTETGGGFSYELGPSSMNAKHPAVADLIFERLRLGPRVERRNADAKNFFVVRDGRVVPVPRSPIQFFLSKLLSWNAKRKVLAEPLVARLPAHQAERETVSQFFRRRFGSEFLEYVIDPGIAGIYSASPDDLSMKHALNKFWRIERKKGSVLVGLFTGAAKTLPDPRYGVYSGKELLEGFSFDKGMQVLPQSMVEHIRAMNKQGRFYSWSKVRTLDRDGDGSWRVNGRGKYDAVISTLPTHALGSVYTKSSAMERYFTKLAKNVRYSPVAIAVLGFDKSQVPARLDGFGSLVPSREGRKILGINYSSSNFPKRVDDPNKVYLTVYVGGGRSPELVHRSGKKIVETSTKELQDLLGVKGKPFFSRVKTWTMGIPQYDPGYDEMLCTMARLENSAPGLVLGGNYRGGVGVPDALLSGIKSAEKVVSYLKENP